MTMLEDEIAALLKAAPGEPPQRVDPEALLDVHAPRHRFFAPLLAAVVVAAVAVAVTVLARPTGHVPARPGPITSAPQTHPKAHAVQLVETALHDAALPPGARVADHRIRAAEGAGSSSGSPNEVRRSRTWTAPGTVAQTVTYLRDHPPAGLRANCWSCGSASLRTVYFRRGHNPVEVDYVIAPYRGGVAIKVDTWAVWTPKRPSWSDIRDALISVDVTVVRSGAQRGYPGAPTVHRTLRGAAATRLAAAFDHLPVQAQFTSLGGPMRAVEATDKAVFHTEHGDVIAVNRPYSEQLTVTSPTHESSVYLGGDFEGPVLRALGLPSDYGMGR